MTRYRIDELAARAGTSVDTIRFYQHKGLLPRPERDGRISWYDDGHLERLRRIAAFKDQGFTLASIRRLLDGELEPADERLVAALAGSAAGDGASRARLTLDELAQRTGVSVTLLEAIEREGLIESTGSGGHRFYTESDVKVLARGLELLEAGLPLSELLALAREHDYLMKEIAARAVDLFIRFVRDPLLAETASESEAAERLVQAFQKMLPATTDLVAHHFERVLLREAMARVDREATDAEQRAVEQERRRMGMDR
ncbi:MAG: MerR family transcriptional regulator [Actinomycetota bacterium]